ncbi:glycosyltransferase family 32 protein, partial [Alistipes ihumii]
MPLSGVLVSFGNVRKCTKKYRLTRSDSPRFVTSGRRRSALWPGRPFRKSGKLLYLSDKRRRMIPKIIHYCWFGRGKMPELAEHCLASWRKFLPDYELKLWNEDSFDVNRLRFTRQAYERRKFAFVTDYVRLYALKSFGGIYMDTDVEVLRSLDDLLGL